MSEIEIRKLAVEDWQEFRTIRLRALKTNQAVFGGTYEDAEQRATEHWKEMLSDKRHAFFCLYEQAKIIGLTGVFTWREDPTNETALFVMSFIEPDYRGKGLSKLFYEARIDWCLQQAHFTKILVGHREGNDASRRANQAFGFKLVSKKMDLWPDGSQDYLYEYELDLVSLRQQKGIKFDHG
jgi:RimJ/RimL family protein N-acetyltransferase